MKLFPTVDGGRVGSTLHGGSVAVLQVISSPATLEWLYENVPDWRDGGMYGEPRAVADILQGSADSGILLPPNDA